MLLQRLELRTNKPNPFDFRQKIRYKQKFYVSTRNILFYPHPVLRKKSHPVRAFDADLATLVADMQLTMYRANGIGLAAAQVGVLQQVIVADVSPERNQSVVLINPEIVNKEGTQVREEGCLSLPGFFEAVRRAENIEVNAQDVDGEQHVLNVSGLLATVIQHECDHLHGRLFVDHLSQIKRMRIRKKLLKSREHA